MSDASAIIIGGGIAGVSAAFHLAPHFDVTLLEREPTLAYHTTGRSAAQYVENYGVPAVRALTKSSRGFFDSPPEGLTDHPLLAPCAVMMIARPDQIGRLEATEAAEMGGAEMRSLTPAQAVALSPILRPDYLGGALLEDHGADIDVAALHQAFVRGIRARGGTIRPTSAVSSIVSDGSGWAVGGNGFTERADVVINASGAWGDEVAALAGIEPVGLVPKRRTAFMVTAPDGLEGSPMVIDIDEAFYWKPDGHQLLCSPAEEKPSEPCDARPREIDIAIAIDRINQATTLSIRSVRSSWTGLRTFTADHSPVMGEDPDHMGFIWLVGQGGTGITTAPAAGALVASLLVNLPLPGGIDATHVEALSPKRLRAGGTT